MRKNLVLNNNKVCKMLCNILISVFIVAALCAVCSMKAGYNVDEIYSFGLANHQYEGSIVPDLEEGVVYTGQQLWQEYLTVSEGHSFDYENVWANQAADVHPPLYYALIHTVCSFFPSSFSIWMGLSVNIVLAVIVFWQMVWLFNYFIRDRKLAVAVALLFLFTMGFVNNVVFIRMYVLLTVWTNALAILFCKYGPKNDSRFYYPLLMVILLGGMMTQYYFLIFAFFLCLTYGILLIKERNWKKIFLSGCSAFVSFLIATFLFHSMWSHILWGYRGTESFDNLTEKNLWESLQVFLKKINLEVYGNLFFILVLFGILLCILLWLKSRRRAEGDVVSTASGIAGDAACDFAGREQKRMPDEKNTAVYWMLLIPTLCDVILIAKISPYDIDRYVMNMMGLLYLLMFVPLIRLARRLSEKAVAGVLMAAVLVLVCSYQNGVPYLYKSETAKLAAIEELDEDVYCLYLYDAVWKILPNYQEMKNLEQIEFINRENLDVLNGEDYQNYDKLLVFVGQKVKAKDVLEQLVEQNPELDTYTKLFKTSYAKIYYLE